MSPYLKVFSVHATDFPAAWTKRPVLSAVRVWFQKGTTSPLAEKLDFKLFVKEHELHCLWKNTK